MKPTHGGKRPGAGRKPANTARKAVTVRLSESARQHLADTKSDTSKSYSAIIEALLTP